MKFVPDIVKLNACLDKSYDFIYLSNIFDHIDDPDNQWQILVPLLKRVNVGGRIVSYQLFSYSKQFPEDSERHKDLVYEIKKNYTLKRYYTGLTQVDKLNVFERVR